MKYSSHSRSFVSFDGVSKKDRHKASSNRTHSWLTVIDPRNHRLLLQACDDCGVVKSENSVMKSCRPISGQALLSSEMSAVTRIAI